MSILRSREFLRFHRAPVLHCFLVKNGLRSCRTYQIPLAGHILAILIRYLQLCGSAFLLTVGIQVVLNNHVVHLRFPSCWIDIFAIQQSRIIWCWSLLTFHQISFIAEFASCSIRDFSLHEARSDAAVFKTSEWLGNQVGHVVMIGHGAYVLFVSFEQSAF